MKQLTTRLMLLSLAAAFTAFSSLAQDAAQSYVKFNTSTPVGTKMFAQVVPVEGSTLSFEGAHMTEEDGLPYLVIENQDITIKGDILALNLTYGKVNSIELNQPRMDQLAVSTNNIKTLDVSKETVLGNLACDGNPDLKAIDITNMTRLAKLDIARTSISDIDLSKCESLMYLFANRTKITNFNLSHCPNLITLEVAENGLENLDLSNNKVIHFVTCYRNRLSREAVGNLIASLFDRNPFGMDEKSVGKLFIVDMSKPDLEHNQVYSTEVKNALAKNWLVLNYNRNHSKPFLGIDKEASISEVSGNKALKVYPDAEVLRVENADPFSMVSVYNAHGELIMQAFADNHGVSLMPNKIEDKGVYVVTSNSQAIKFAL